MLTFLLYPSIVASFPSPSTADHPLVSHSFQVPSSVINDVAGDPFSSTLDETVGAFLIVAYSMQEGSARKATPFRHQE